MKLKDNIIAAILFAAGVIGLMILFSGCSAVKKVNKDERKQLRVIENYNKKHPFKNDTTIVYKPGDTVTSIVERIDTVATFLPGTNQIEYKYLKGKTVYHTIRDTVFEKVTDRKGLTALQAILNQKEREQNKTNGQIIELTAQVRENKHETNKWKLRFYLLLSLNTLYLLWRLKNLFTPKISIK